MLHRVLIGCSALLGASLLSATGHAQGHLDSAEIQRLVAGQSANWVRHDGRTGAITYHRDGKLVSQVTVFGRSMDVPGTWEVKGDRFCRTIRMDSPPTRCQRVFRVRGGVYRFVNDDGTATTTTFR
jgi:hypothetical protein